jgi:hypothetical protein
VQQTLAKRNAECASSMAVHANNFLERQGTYQNTNVRDGALHAKVRASQHDTHVRPRAVSTLRLQIPFLL